MIGFSLLLAALIAPQTGDDDPCKVAGACRQIESARIEDPNGQVTMVPIGAPLPWVAHENVLLVAGDSVTVKLVKKDGVLTPELVRTGQASATADPGPGEIRFDVGQFERGRLHLTILSRHPQTLDYAALIAGPAGAERTSVCSLMPGVTTIETWQQPIIHLALWNFVPTTEPGCKTLNPEAEPQRSDS